MYSSHVKCLWEILKKLKTNTLLNNPWLKKEMRKYIVWDTNENTVYKNVWDVRLGGKFIALNTNSRKENMSPTSSLLEKEAK